MSNGSTIPAETLRAIAQVPFAICVLAPDFSILTASAMFLKTTGTSLQAIQGKSILTAFPTGPAENPERGDVMLGTSLTKVLVTRMADEMPIVRYDLPDPGRANERRPRYWSTTNTPVPDENGNVSFIIHAITEVTEKVLAEKALLENKEELSDAYHQLQTANESLLLTQGQLQKMNADLEERVEQRTIEWRKAQQSSEKQQQRLTALLDHLPAGLAILEGRNMVLELVNEGMLKLWDRDASIIGKELLDFMPEIREQVFPKILGEVFTSGKSHFDQDAPVQLVINGQLQTVYMDYSYTPLRNAGGEVDSILVLAEDVSARTLSRQREQELMEEIAATNEELSAANAELASANEEMLNVQRNLEQALKDLENAQSHFREMVQQAPVAIGVLTSREMIVDTANNAMLKLWGKTSDILGKPLAAALPELEGQPFQKILDDVYTSGQTYYGNEQKALLVHNGELVEYYFNFIYQPRKDKAGNTESIIIVAVDVNEQVRSRIALERAEELLRFSIEAANVGTWYMELPHKKLVASARMKELFGLQAHEDLSYDKALARIPQPHRQMVVEAIDESVRRCDGYMAEHPVSGIGDDKLRWVRVVGKVYCKDNLPFYFTGIVMDITEQKQDEQRKNDFIGMVSHELKTPLTSTRGYLQILEAKSRKAEDAFTANAVTKAIHQVNKMTNMVNGFLNISRLESGKILIDKQPFNLYQLLLEIKEEMESMHTMHTISISGCHEVVVTADRDKIGNVVSNLLSNAIKYSPKGKEVAIACQLREDFVEVSVRDQGIGIRKADLPRLFDRFYRVENRLTQHISGFGIGLYLSAEIVTRHHGKIWAESEPGGGSTFRFTLPVRE
ncbi:ATP-binding protein [Arcticibacter sp. MXS-1]|uniref:ATP-binding protein n=1 Tax=Arcticibacter sp. MXS-1 TaxID=3341726 RepID=UPI0035A979F7